MRKYFHIFACTFFYSLGANILGFSMIYRLTDKFLFATGQIGIFLALGSVFYFLGCNLYHRFGYVLNPVKVYTTAVAIVFLASLPMGFGSIALVYASYWILQISAGFFWPPIMAHLTAGLGGRELDRVISIYNRSWMAGLLVGPLVSGTIYNWNSSATFFVLSLSYLTALIFLLVNRKSSAASSEEKSKNISSAARNPDRRLDHYRYQGWVLAFCSSMVIGVIVNMIPIHIRDGLGYTERSAGLILALRCFAGFVGFTLVAKFSAWHFNRLWFIILHSIITACILLFILAGSRIVFFTVLVFFCGLFNSACYNNSIFYSSVTGKNPKKNMALHEIFLALGTAVGAAGGGFFYQHFGINGVCTALALALGIGLLVLILFNRKLV